MSLHRRSPLSFLPYNRPCFTRFHLASDRSVNRKTTMRQSAANYKTSAGFFSKIFLCYFRRSRFMEDSCFVSIHSISYFNYRLISSLLNVRSIVLKRIYDYSTTSSIAVCVIMVDNNATYIHDNDTSYAEDDAFGRNGTSVPAIRITNLYRRNKRAANETRGIAGENRTDDRYAFQFCAARGNWNS